MPTLLEQPWAMSGTPFSIQEANNNQMDQIHKTIPHLTLTSVCTHGTNQATDGRDLIIKVLEAFFHVTAVDR